MFTFVARPIFTAPVSVLPPGAAEAQTFTGRFRALPQSETEALQGRHIPPDQIVAANNEWLRLIFVGWEDDLQVDGAPLPVTDDNITMLLDASWIRSAVTLAYLGGISGAARKN